MRRASRALVVAIIGMALAGPAIAQSRPDPLEKVGWTFVAYSDGARIYMRTAAGQKGKNRQAWTLYELGGPRKRADFSFMSVASLGEFDCAAGTNRTLAETFYERPAMKGATRELAGEIPTAWGKHSPGSIGEIKFEFACEARPGTSGA